MDLNMQWHHEIRGKKAVEALEKNGFTAAYFPDRASAAAHLLSLVPDGASVGFGGSMTIQAMDIKPKLTQKGCTLLDHGIEGLTPAERSALRRKQLTSDVFLCSSNALTMQGELVNVDGTGNRVAAMMFGPERVIVVAGTNKLVNTLDEAHARIKAVAGPVNNKRLNYPNPCVQSGECMDCRSKSRLCNLTAIIHRRPPLTDIHVLVIGEALGY
ncbi:MAG: lactate utilization protein [Deltaproteobacteria bacterium]|jgi:L-lactate utilization protein LutB|nr:lactate utilization protein [Deltaproteobacteria bacterium]